ncbi:MAG: hypothetical protein WKF96_21625 [Solirubrobacteraceae bacterium]
MPNDVLTASEKRAAAAALAGAEVARALLQDPHFRKSVDELDPKSVARRYTARASVGREALIRLVERCQSAPTSGKTRFSYIAAQLSGWSAWADAPAPPSRFRLAEVQRGTEALLRLGAGLCTVCGRPRSKTAGGRLFCHLHTPDGPESVRQSDRRRARREVDSALSALAGVVYRGDRADLDRSRPAQAPAACEDVLLRPPGLDWVPDDEWSEHVDRMKAIYAATERA